MRQISTLTRSPEKIISVFSCPKHIIWIQPRGDIRQTQIEWHSTEWNWSALFKKVKVIKGKERLKNHSWLKEITKRAIHVMSGPWLDPGPWGEVEGAGNTCHKGHYREIVVIWIWTVWAGVSVPFPGADYLTVLVDGNVLILGEHTLTFLWVKEGRNKANVIKWYQLVNLDDWYTGVGFYKLEIISK